MELLGLYQPVNDGVHKTWRERAARLGQTSGGIHSKQLLNAYALQGRHSGVEPLNYGGKGHVTYGLGMGC